MAAKTAEYWQKKVGSEYAPSEYQCNIFDWILNGRGNAVVEAVAGAGKTTTIILGAQLVAGFGVYIAFSKAVVEEIKPKLQGTTMEPRTVHSIGNGAIWFNNRNIKIETKKDKYKSYLKGIENKMQKSKTLFGRPLSKTEISEMKKGKKIKLPLGVILDLFSKARLDLIDFEGKEYPNILWDLANHHNTEIPDGLGNVISETIRHLAQWGRDTIGEIDFTDMVWLPVVNNWQPKRWSWVFVDECQDISPAQLALIKKCIRPGGRVLAIGDRRQAIFGFAGANAQSFQQIIKEMKADVLPLSVCYRCPISGIDLAKKWVPQIEAAPNAPEGKVDNLSFEEMIEEVREGDMILCRRNAPLIGTAFTIIAKGIPAIVKGRAFGEGLIKTVEFIARDTTFQSFGKSLDKWLNKEKESTRNRGGDESSIQQKCLMLDDTAGCIRAICGRSEVDSIQKLIGAIDNLFSDDRGSVTLSSIHRSKGLENDRIFLLGSTEIYFKGQKKWQREQEENLSYVAHTRHKEHLFFVEERKEDDK